MSLSKFVTCFLLGFWLSAFTLVNGQVNVFKSNAQSKNPLSVKNKYLTKEFDSISSFVSYPKADSLLNVVVINYTDLKSVLRYKKLEFGVQLPMELSERINHFLDESGVLDSDGYLNPFLEWDIDVEATFHHAVSGTIKKIDGFYTRDYIANNQTDDWDEVSTDYPFRLRFAPPENGEWKAVITIRINRQEKPAYFSNEFSFNVIESGDPGYVKVFENGRNFQQGEEMIYPIGTNFPADFPCVAWGGICYEEIPGDPVRRLDGKDTIYYGHNLYSNNNTEKSANVYAWNQYLKSLSKYFQSGGKYIRTIQMPWSTLIEFERKGNYYKRLHYAWEQDKILDSLEKYDALMIFNMLLQSPHIQYDHFGTSDWDWDYDIRNEKGELVTDSWVYDKPRYAYNDRPQGQKKARESFTNKSDLEYHKQRTRYYLARYGYSTKIMEFEILSEPFHVDSQVEVKDTSGNIIIPGLKPYEVGTETKDAIYNYHKVISEYLKDSLQINQLVGVDMGYYVSIDLKSVQLPSIDVAGVNFYYASPSALYATAQQQIVEAIWDSRGSKIPVLFPEGGIDENYMICSDYTQHAVDMMTFPFSSLAGYFSWNGWREKENHLWKATIGVQNALNGSDLLQTLSQENGEWTLGKAQAEVDGITKYAVETQYYISQNQEKGMGYVRNRTYNISSEHIANDPCYHLGNELYNTFEPINWFDVDASDRLRVNRLKKRTTYQVDWYSIYSSHKDGLIKSECMTTSKKNGIWGFDLKYPKLGDKVSGNSDYPVVWFVIRTGCKSDLEQYPLGNILQTTLPFFLK